MLIRNTALIAIKIFPSLTVGREVGDAVGALNDDLLADLLDFGLLCEDAVGAFDVGFFSALDPLVPADLDFVFFVSPCLGGLGFSFTTIS